MSIVNTLRFIANHPLNRDHKLDAMVRFAKWQIGCRLVPGPVVCEWINGSKMVVRPGETGLTGNIYCGLHEFPDMAYLLHVIRPEDVFLDVGANVGSYTILACAASGARGVCFEPVPSTFERLCENVRINELEERVQAHNLGLGDENGELSFTTGRNSASNHVLAEGESSADAIRVDVRTLDSVVGDASATIMKIDVEGFETPALKGADAVLSNPSLYSIIMELNGAGARYGYSEDAILETMLGYGFTTHSYDPLTRTLHSLHGKNLHEGNTLFIRDENFVKERIATAPRIQVLSASI